MSGFTHLHVHTVYSLLDGASKIPELVSKAKELGMDAMAITDHGAMYGVIDFYKECTKQGIKPILMLRQGLFMTGRASGNTLTSFCLPNTSGAIRT